MTSLSTLWIPTVQVQLRAKEPVTTREPLCFMTATFHETANFNIFLQKSCKVIVFLPDSCKIFAINLKGFARFLHVVQENRVTLQNRE